MKKVFLSLTICAYILAGCSGDGTSNKENSDVRKSESTTEKHDHDHDHAAGEAHDHDHDHAAGEAHDHDHDHAAGEAHDHDHDHAAGEAHDHDHDHAAGEADDHAAEEAAHSDEIVIEPEKAEALGLQVITVTPSDFRQVIKTSGQIQSAQGDEATIVAPVAGIVSFGKTPVIDGSAVKAGSTVLTLSAKTLADGDPSEKARIAYETAKQEYERYSELVKDQIVSQKEFNQVKEAYETAKVAYDAVAKNRTVNGNRVSSPLTGYVKDILVGEGDYVTVGQPLMTVSQNRRLVLRAEVSERYYKELKQIGSANFKTPYDDRVYQLSDLNGRLVSFGKTSNSNTFYVPVVFEFDNKGEIVSGSYVEVYLLSVPMKEVLTVPVSALTEEQGLYFVYLKLDDECYKKQEVKTGMSDGRNMQIVAGLKPGDVVVSEGAFQVKLASKSNVIPEGHSH